MTRDIFEADFKAEEVTKFLEEASKKIKDMRPLMKLAAHNLKTIVDKNLDTNGTHTGEKWKEWSDKWKKQRLKKAKVQGKLLNYQGHLRGHIHSEYDNTTAAVIASDEYAAAHNFGCTKTVEKKRYNKKKKSLTRFTCNMNMPKREFMRINDIEQDYLIADLTVKLKELLMEGGK